MTGEYTFVTAERQNELTRRIQAKLSNAAKKDPAGQIVLPHLADVKTATPILQ